MPLLALHSMCIRECVRSFYFYAAVVKAFNQAARQKRFNRVWLGHISRSEPKQERWHTATLIIQSHYTRKDMCDRIHLVYCCCSVTNRSSHRRRFREKLQLQSETANYGKVVLLEVTSLPREPLFFVHPPSTNQLFFFFSQTENWTIISKIRGIILMSVRLDKGNFCNHELLLCKLIFCWHQGSTSPAKASFSLRVGLAGGSLTISTQIVRSSLYQKSSLSRLTINSSGWLIGDIKWVVVGGEYLMIWMILILRMMWFFMAVFSHQQVQTQQRNVQQMIQTNYWHQIYASPICAV